MDTATATVAPTIGLLPNPTANDHLCYIVLFCAFFVYFSQPERITHAIFMYIMHIRAYSCRTLRGPDVGLHYLPSSNYPL